MDMPLRRMTETIEKRRPARREAIPGARTMRVGVAPVDFGIGRHEGEDRTNRVDSMFEGYSGP